MAYLTYIVEHYFDLPEIIVFLHPHRNGYPQAWHTDVADYDNVLSLNALRLDFVRHSGYVNLRCNWVPGCPVESVPLRGVSNGDQDPRAEETKEAESLVTAAWRYMFDTGPPKEIGQACCSQFAVTRDQVLARSHADYSRYRQWIIDTPASDMASGRVLEYFWHVIFGQEPVL